MLFAIWLMAGGLFGLLCGLRAIRRNRSAVGWFLLGLGFGPIALAVAMTRPKLERPAFL